MILSLFILFLFLYSLVSERLEKTVVTAPMLFAGLGLVLGILYPSLVETPPERHFLLGLAEIGLVLLLFTDACRVNLGLLRRFYDLPVRLLLLGTPLTILLGAGLALWLLPIGPWEACILATVLAPTDAGLGQVIVESPRVPVRIREALNIEAGLNDGLCVPFLLFFMALSQAGEMGSESSFLRYVVEQLGYATVIGLGIGVAGGWLLERSRQAGWSRKGEQVGIVALPLLCALASEHFGASMFIAAFVAGLGVQTGARHAERLCTEFVAGWGQILNLSIFFAFGLLFVRGCRDFPVTGAVLVYALCSLTIVRMLPVALAARSLRFAPSTLAFLGWFGPRGLASLVLGLVYLETEASLPGDAVMKSVVSLTVLLSILLHGASAQPGTRWYQSKLAGLGPDIPELRSSDP